MGIRNATKESGNFLKDLFAKYEDFIEVKSKEELIPVEANALQVEGSNSIRGKIVNEILHYYHTVPSKDVNFSKYNKNNRDCNFASIISKLCFLVNYQYFQIKEIEKANSYDDLDKSIVNQNLAEVSESVENPDVKSYSDEQVKLYNNFV